MDQKHQPLCNTKKFNDEEFRKQNRKYMTGKFNTKNTNDDE